MVSSAALVLEAIVDELEKRRQADRVVHRKRSVERRCRRLPKRALAMVVERPR
ncbi:hypothetical protein [Halorubrum tropicale]|uniref:hypothetical protein n=1 Tax=Halorubrum tropicale TaxID=1765655 RepID=UPI000B265057|nr:hypothetical protein [Halorubrum tropicale]